MDPKVRRLILAVLDVVTGEDWEKTMDETDTTRREVLDALDDLEG